MTPMTTPHTRGKSIVARRSANTERKVQQRKVSRKIMMVTSWVSSQGR